MRNKRLVLLWSNASHLNMTLPETNSSPLKMMIFNRNLLFQGSIFRGYVSFREGIEHHSRIPGFASFFFLQLLGCFLDFPWQNVDFFPTKKSYQAKTHHTSIKLQKSGGAIGKFPPNFSPSSSFTQKWIRFHEVGLMSWSHGCIFSW